ncbi:LOW QUALITY PROTEIN: hypothetical protein PHMEG_00016509 [Phytophthora megakarya]|uniref:Uncharacterized protein n=1 Tax=Phytophthora megakarya TaxID=4795 RepID=A0A225VZ48_9STRA|nr:LOW QUALITY PROTEIN: hypothetical protein PHMEG_00016509 [Phytophthora megakarya]
MSKIECMRDGLEENQTTKGKRTVPMTMTLSPASATILALETTGEARLVGIPATREHLRSDTFVQDGYGGLEVLILMESLGLLASLPDYVAEGEAIYDYIMTPRETPLLDGELDEVVKSVEFQREVALVLTEFTPDQFSQRVFGTVSVLRKVTAERIVLSRQLAVANQTTQVVAKCLVEIERLNKDLAFVRAGYKQRVQKIDEDHEFHAGKHRADHQKYLAEDRANLHDLQAQVWSLQAQLRAVNARNDTSQRPRMNYLHLGKTTISVMAADDPSVPTTAYVPVSRPDRDGDEEQKDSDRPQDLLRGSFLDLTCDSESDSSKSSGKRKRSSKCPQKVNKHSQSDTPIEIQEYSSGWIHDSDGPCRPDGDLLLRDADAAREILKPFPVIWKQLRLDVRALILYGINYEGALEWLDEDRPVHGCFHQRSLLEMLLRMMFWNELDGTPWTRYVPRRYYVAARAKLDSLLENDGHPDLWGTLIPVMMDHLTPEQDDPTDQNWTNDAEGGDNDDEDDYPLEETPSKSTRAKTKRRRIAPAETRQRIPPNADTSERPHLTADEMMVIEVPRNDKVRSWVHFGVRMKWCDKSLNSPFGQTPGFPAYTHSRFGNSTKAFRGLLRGIQRNPSRSAVVRYVEESSKIAILPERSAMTPAAQGSLDAWVAYMCESMRHQWEMLHWVIFLLEFLPKSAVLADSRRGKRHESLVKKGRSLKKRCVQKGVPKTVFEWEASVWDIPHRVCHWIIMDKSQIDPATQKPYPLREQLQRLDKAEPARLQWTNCDIVEEQIATFRKLCARKFFQKRNGNRFLRTSKR